MVDSNNKTQELFNMTVKKLGWHVKRYEKCRMIYEVQSIPIQIFITLKYNSIFSVVL